MDRFWNKYDYPLTDMHALKLIKKKAKAAVHAEKEGQDPFIHLKEAHDMITDFFKYHGLDVEVGTVSVVPVK